jgi:hypothetical protein
MNTNDKNMEASFSVLTMSIASSAAISLGLAPDPQSGQTHKDKSIAKFNIDLLLMLRDKTKGNLTTEESQFILSITNDLQSKYLQM